MMCYCIPKYCIPLIISIFQAARLNTVCVKLLLLILAARSSPLKPTSSEELILQHKFIRTTISSFQFYFN